MATTKTFNNPLTNNSGRVRWVVEIYENHKLAFWALAVGTYLVGDVATTILGLHVGLVEGNPTMTFINGFTPLTAGLIATGLKLVLFGGIGIFGWLAEQAGFRSLKIVVMVMLVRLAHMGLLVTVSNVQEVFIYLR